MGTDGRQACAIVSRMFPFERLVVWQAAHALAVRLYRDVTPWEDRDLRAQIRRCAASVPANIAEGAGSESQPQFAKYVGFANASASELRYHLRFAHDVGLISPARYAEYDEAATSIRRMLNSLQKRLRHPSP